MVHGLPNVLAPYGLSWWLWDLIQLGVALAIATWLRRNFSSIAVTVGIAAVLVWAYLHIPSVHETADTMLQGVFALFSRVAHSKTLVTPSKIKFDP